jgi:hypothetical protein
MGVGQFLKSLILKRFANQSFSKAQGILLVGSIINMTVYAPFHMNGDLVASTNTFLKFVYSILTLLQSWPFDMTTISKVTGRNLVFACFHNIFIITLTLIYVVGESFAEATNDIGLVTSSIVSLYPGGFSGLDPLHPLLLEAMQSLLHAKQSNLQTLNT